MSNDGTAGGGAALVLAPGGEGDKADCANVIDLCGSSSEDEMGNDLQDQPANQLKAGVPTVTLPCDSCGKGGTYGSTACSCTPDDVMVVSPAQPMSTFISIRKYP